MIPRIGLRAVLCAAVALALCSAGASVASAQQRGGVTGTVIDQATRQPLAGAQVMIGGTQRGAVTDQQGRFLITNVPAGARDVTVSELGYTGASRTVTVTAGAPVTADFELVQSALNLQGLVVTALGVQRQAKELAYSTTQVSSEEVTRAPTTNFVNALAGNAPGVDVVTQSGNVGGSTRIVIRGVSSLSGDNQPLFVVDGVPISNANTITATGDPLTGAIDVGNRASDVNPQDIASVTVLKGAAAAALYGQRAKDGVILIKTKRGIAGQTSITATSSETWSSPLVLPDFQNTYAQGGLAGYDSLSLNGWGPTIAGQQVTNIMGEDVTLTPYPNNVSDFYRSGLFAVNSVSLASANEQADFRLGATQQNQKGIVPNSKLNRTSLTLNSGYKVKPNLQVRLTGTYVKTDTRGKAAQGGNDPVVLTSIVNFMPRTFDTDDLRDYKNEDGEQRVFGPTTNNPFWVANEDVFTNGVERIFGSASVQYSPASWLTLTGRSGLDYYTEDRRHTFAVGTVGHDKGSFSTNVIESRQLNLDLMAEATKQVSSDFHLRGLVGFNANGRESQILWNDAQNLTVPALYNIANALANTPGNTYSQRHLYGVYGDVTVGFRDYLFLDVTGRNDWSSTLPKANRSFFYPSANLSYVFTDALDLNSSWLTFGKLRANVAQVGSDEDPYQLDFLYTPQSDVFGQYGTGPSFPFGGLVAFSSPSIRPPTNLKPQKKTAWELGGELEFFNGRAGLDLTYYNQSTSDQIIAVPIPAGTGFRRLRTNIGEVQNKGVEVQANVTPVRNRLLSWEAVVNFAHNDNKVVSLAPGVKTLIVASAYNTLQVLAEPGKSLGLYGTGWMRDPDGNFVIDEDTGLRLAGGSTRFGSIDPDFTMSLDNRFSFGRASVNFLITWRKGGSIFSSTASDLRNTGLAEETAENRNGSFIYDGVNMHVSEDKSDTTYTPNQTPVSSMQSFWENYASSLVPETSVFDATNVRLRTLQVNYDVPTRWLGNLPISSLTLGLEGRNLLMLYKKVPHIDPEVGLFGSASNGQGIEQAVLPPTRTFGLNVQVKL